jgi:hypothetical protein
MRVAIIEFKPYHTEVIPSWINYFNKMGFVPDIFINQKSLIDRGNVFELFPSLRFNLEYVSLSCRPDWNSLKSKICDADYDLILINTFHTAGSGWASTLPGLKLCVVHDAVKFFKNKLIFSLCAYRNDIKLVTLNSSTAQTISQLYSLEGSFKEVNRLTATYFEDNFTKPISDKVIIGIVGGINFNTRNYGQLISWLSSGFHSDRLLFKVIGGGKDYDKLSESISNAGLNNQIVIASKGGRIITHYEYFSLVSQSNFLITLFHPHSRYFYSAISSVINFSLGFSVPLIQDSITKSMYGIPGYSIENFNSINVLQAISSIDDAHIKMLRIKTQLLNAELNNDSFNCLKKILS